jgi:hypothetical protein
MVVMRQMLSILGGNSQTCMLFCCRFALMSRAGEPPASAS